MKDFNKAIGIDSGDSEAYYYRGISKLKAKLYYEALDDLKQ
jgi:hypothetical protein